MAIHTGGCHCGNVRFEVRTTADMSISQCNCSICTKSGYLALIVPKDRFRLLSGHDSLTEYAFNTGTAKHKFCTHCGIKSFYVPHSHPEGVSVNARCLDATQIQQLNITEFDRQNWELHYPKGRAEVFPNLRIHAFTGGSLSGRSTAWFTDSVANDISLLT